METKLTNAMQSFPFLSAGFFFFKILSLGLIVTGSATGSSSVNRAPDENRDQSFASAHFNLATYNIFYYTPEDHQNSWSQRRDHVARIIQFHDIAFWGSQEGEHNQLQDLQEMLGHKYVGDGRDDGDTEGEHSAIFYDPEQFRALESETFWLSKTPDRPSKDWDVNFYRICTWGRFLHIDSGIEFYAYNVHFDHESQQARENSSRLVLRHIDEHVEEGTPVVFMGDLNAVPGNTAYEKVIAHGLLNDAFEISRLKPHGPEGTFNGFDITRSPDRRIDYLFFTDHFDVHRYGVLTDTYLLDGMRFPSDHFPVLTGVTLSE